ncbi:MAG: glycosyltransferase family 4 protein [Chloroflexota bacterium]|jgi:glycosyltransferase involved in cell wall biosynthesis
MRIAIVGNFGLGGKQTMAVRALPIAQALVKRGHAVQMALPVRCREDRDGHREIEGVQIRLADPKLRVGGLSHLWQLMQLARYCWEWRPEALYCFKPIAYSGAILALFRGLRRLRLYHGLIALDTDDWEGKGGWSERFSIPRWLKGFIAAQESWCLRHADVVTVASLELAELIKSTGRAETIYLPNAISASSPGLLASTGKNLHSILADEQTSPGSASGPFTLTGDGQASPGSAGGSLAPLGDRRPIVLLYTRFVEFGVKRVLDVLEQILARRGDALLLVVGRGLEGEDEELRKAAADRGIDQSLHLAGWVPSRELPDYFAAADVAIYPMDDTLLNRSKCPMKMLDLLAAGVPVVADSVGQACEYISDGRTGVLVNPDSPQMMAEAVVSLLEDRSLRQVLSENARKDVQARWSWDRWAPVVENALTSYPTTRSGSPPAPIQTPDPR